MIKQIYKTTLGEIHYWTSKLDTTKNSIVFLPGLTATNVLFEKQIDFFQNNYNVLVWDAPGHGLSRPFDLSFSLFDKASWLHEILARENIVAPIFVGQSMGGYLAQTYMELYPNEISAFVSIDSAPLQRDYYSKLDLYLMKNIEWAYRLYPWKLLLVSGSKGCAETIYGQSLMKGIMQNYSKDEFCRLTAYGYKMLASAIESNLAYKLTCRTILICGEKDKAGLTKNYNKRWAKKQQLDIYWIPNAGHNSNTDAPEIINELILKAISGNDEELSFKNSENSRTRSRH